MSGVCCCTLCVTNPTACETCPNNYHYEPEVWHDPYEYDAYEYGDTYKGLEDD